MSVKVVVEIGVELLGNKKSFEKWLNEQPLSETTINNYLRGIRYVEEKLPHLSDDKKILNVYGIMESSKVNEILNNIEFITYDKLGNRMSSSGLKKYKEFIETANKNVEALDVLKKGRDNKRDITIIDDVVLIKINQSYHDGISPEDLFKVTSVSWKVSLEKTSTRDIKYYCAVYNNVIIEVYELTGFTPDTRPEKEGRYILKGNLADKEIRDQLISLDIHSIHKGSGNPIKYTKLKTLLYLKEHGKMPSEVVIETIEKIEEVDLIDHIHSFITSKGFNYSLPNIKNLYLSLRSKPFVIISGISGTGKTKIVQLFAESVGATEENGQFKLIPVRPDWSDSSELLGYLDLKGEFQKGTAD